MSNNSESNGNGAGYTVQPSGPHRYQVGNPGGPGRPTKAKELQVLDAIKADWPPERVAEALNQAMTFATETRSWRGILAVCELAMAYTIGRPQQKVQVSDGNLEQLLAYLQDDHGPLLPSPAQPEG